MSVRRAGRPTVARNSIHWADLGGAAGRRPVLVLSRDAAAAVLDTVMVAPITRTVRGIRSELPLGALHGLPEACVANCDHVTTMPVDRLDAEPVGSLTFEDRLALDAALRYALDILG